ncbi:MAG: hypothetical protein ACI4W6_10390 [Acutalibacteraceae bacterium]
MKPSDSPLSVFGINPGIGGNSKGNKLPDIMSSTEKVRRTDEQAKNLPLSWPRKSASSVDVHRGSLKTASSAVNITGVYILKLNGQVMKVGSAEIGVQKRMQQYYGLNKSCGLAQINEHNRDLIQVIWQDCPRCKCNELESKLARKYGMGPWAIRTPHSTDDTWKLLI